MVLQVVDQAVSAAAMQLMAVDSTDEAQVCQRVLAQLVEVLDVNSSFLLHNDCDGRPRKMIAQWPAASHVSGANPLDAMSADDVDALLYARQAATEPVVWAHSGVDLGRRAAHATDVPAMSSAAAPLLSGASTTGVVAFTKDAGSPWAREELNALLVIASMFAQLQARLSAESRLRYIADHDDLTGLLNRRAAIAQLDDRLLAGRPGPVPAILLHLDQVEQLNSRVGYPAGDLLVKGVAEHLRTVVGDRSVIGRLDQSELIVAPSETLDGDGARALADELRNGVAGYAAIGDDTVWRSASVGVAVCMPGRDTASDLIQRAGEAVMSARSNGANFTAIYSEGMSIRRRLRNDVELHLRDGIKRDALSLHYLPEVDLRSGQVLAVEALVRWRHPTRGLLSADSFVGTADSINLTMELNHWVLRAACEQLAGWRSRGVGRDVMMRVNVSPAQDFDASFVCCVADLINEFDLRGGSLCLEITEGAVVADIGGAREKLMELRDLGVTVAIDDFGTGYSVLSHLKMLPVDTLKIDREFVRHLAFDRENRAIVQSIIGLAEAFGLEVVAEGVETAAAAEALLDHGCHRAQGFLLSRPMAGRAIETLLRRRRISRVFAPPLASSDRHAAGPTTTILWHGER